MAGRTQSTRCFKFLAVSAICGSLFIPAVAGAQLPDIPNVNPPNVRPKVPNPRIPRPRPTQEPTRRVPDVQGALPKDGVTLGQHGNLGAQFKQQSMVLSEVQADSLGAKAGLKAGDKILAVNDSWVRSQRSFASALQSAVKADGRAWVYVERGGKRTWVDVTTSASASQRGSLGILVSDQNNVARITKVQEGTPAAKAGLKAGDEIISANGKRITSYRQLTSEIQAAASADSQLELTVRRNGELQTIRTRLDQVQQAGTNQLSNAQSQFDDLNQTLQQLADQKTGEARQRVQAAQQRAQTLKSRLAELARQQNERARQQAGELRKQVMELKGNLTDVAQEAGGETKQRLQESIDGMAELSAHLKVVAEGQASAEIAGSQADQVRQRAADFAQNIDQRVAGTRQQLAAARKTLDELANQKQSVVERGVNETGPRKTLDELANQKQGQARQRIQQTQQQLDRFESRISKLADQSQEQIRAQAGQLHQQARELQQSLRSVASDASQQVKQSLNKSIEVVGSFAADASGEARSTAGATAQARGRIVASVEGMQKDLEKLEDAIEGQPQLVSQIQGQVRKLHEDVSGLADKQGKQVSQQVGQAKSRLTQIRKNLRQLADRAPATAKQQLQQVQQRADTLSERLDDFADSLVSDPADKIDGEASTEGKARLGVTVRSNGQGMEIATVAEGEAAAAAGLRPGDTITAINGQQIRSLADLKAELRAAQGTQVKIQYVRRGQTQSAEIDLGDSN